jgi:hypothetical protein
MRIANCPRCGKQNPVFDGKTIKCQRCRLMVTLSTTVTNFLETAEEMWGSQLEVTLRNNKRITNVIEQQDEYLRQRGDSNVISSLFEDSYRLSEGSDDYDSYDDSN